MMLRDPILELRGWIVDWGFQREASQAHGLLRACCGALSLFFFLSNSVASDALIPPKPLGDNQSAPYPPRAYNAKVEGEVTFKAQVNEDGVVESIEIVSVPKEDMGFEEAVQKAVKSWRFEPGREDSHPVASTYEGSVAFWLVLPYDRMRMYARSAREVWQALRDQIREMGLREYRIDEKAGVLITSWERYSREIFWQWHRTELPKRFLPREFQIHVFVPLEAEPGRVYLGSFVRAEEMLGRETATFYNLGTVEASLFEAFEKRLGEKGRPIPEKYRRRRALVQSLLGEGVGDPCTAREDTPTQLNTQIASTKGTRPPEVIKLSKIEPIYDLRDLKAHKSGRILLKAQILEDGAVVDVSPLTNERPSNHFLESALNAVSLWRYKPARRDGCPIPIAFTVVADYNLK